MVMVCGWDAFTRYGAAAGSGATPTRVAIYGDMGNSEFNNMGNLAAGKGATTACPFCLNLLKCTLAGRLGVHPPHRPHQCLLFSRDCSVHHMGCADALTPCLCLSVVIVHSICRLRIRSD